MSVFHFQLICLSIDMSKAFLWLNKPDFPSGASKNSAVYMYMNETWHRYILSFRNGYLGASKNFNAKDLEVDATGQSFVITGANSGLGKAAALAIAKKGKRATHDFSRQSQLLSSAFLIFCSHLLMFLGSLYGK